MSGSATCWRHLFRLWLPSSHRTDANVISSSALVRMSGSFAVSLDRIHGCADLCQVLIAYRQTHSPVFRFTAAVAMLVWLIGQTLCLHHCAQLTFAKGMNSCCAKKENGSRPSSQEKDKLPCGSLKLAKLESKPSLSATTPPSPSAFGPAPVLVLRHAVGDRQSPDFDRTRPRMDWIFRPKMSLGPVLCGLAPPAAV